MDNVHLSDSENEYRLYLERESRSDPQGFAEHLAKLAVEARKGFEEHGRGALLVVDDSSGGTHAFVPMESADLQFGKEAARLCRKYDPEREWILVGITNGRLFPIVMPRV